MSNLHDNGINWTLLVTIYRKTIKFTFFSLVFIECCRASCYVDFSLSNPHFNFGEVGILLGSWFKFRVNLQIFNHNFRVYEDEEDYVIESPDSTSIFVLCNFLYVASIMAFSISKPFRKPFYSNVFFTSNIIAIWVLNILLTFFKWVINFIYENNIDSFTKFRIWW